MVSRRACEKTSRLARDVGCAVSCVQMSPMFSPANSVTCELKGGVTPSMVRDLDPRGRLAPTAEDCLEEESESGEASYQRLDQGKDDDWCVTLLRSHLSRGCCDMNLFTVSPPRRRDTSHRAAPPCSECPAIARRRRCAVVATAGAD